MWDCISVKENNRKENNRNEKKIEALFMKTKWKTVLGEFAILGPARFLILFSSFFLCFLHCLDWVILRENAGCKESPQTLKKLLNCSVSNPELFTCFSH